MKTPTQFVNSLDDDDSVSWIDLLTQRDTEIRNSALREAAEVAYPNPDLQTDYCKGMVDASVAIPSLIKE